MSETRPMRAVVESVAAELEREAGEWAPSPLATDRGWAATRLRQASAVRAALAEIDRLRREYDRLCTSEHVTALEGRVVRLRSALGQISGLHEGDFFSTSAFTERVRRIAEDVLGSPTRDEIDAALAAHVASAACEGPDRCWCYTVPRNKWTLRGNQLTGEA